MVEISERGGYLWPCDRCMALQPLYSVNEYALHIEYLRHKLLSYLILCASTSDVAPVGEGASGRHRFAMYCAVGWVSHALPSHVIGHQK